MQTETLTEDGHTQLRRRKRALYLKMATLICADGGVVREDRTTWLCVRRPCLRMAAPDCTDGGVTCGCKATFSSPPRGFLGGWQHSPVHAEALSEDGNTRQCLQSLYPRITALAVHAESSYRFMATLNREPRNLIDLWQH